MCGIAGILGHSTVPLDLLATKMTEAFPYRGPDDKGVWVDGANFVALGHRRLSILDTSSAGRQPMGDEENNLVIVHNGEIYNFIELRRELKQKGYRFKTDTDTEVILASYKEWGADCLNRFNGMWAFAIWDIDKQSLFLARDRMGIKPLYYYDHGDTLYFASETKAILRVVQDVPDIDHSLIDTYMGFGYIPGEDTLFKGIKRLLPGHSMVVSNGRCEIKKYWDYHFLGCGNEDLGLDYYVDKGERLLKDAIDLRLRSDVPLGVFLSGGLDSSAVVGLLAHRSQKGLKTFSVAYDFGEQYNETRFARLVAQRFNTDHHELFVTSGEFKDCIPDYIRFMDEPVTESAAISLYLIAKLAKEHVTVILSGEGADEVFAGYDFYRYNMYIERYRRLVDDRVTHLFKHIGEKYLPDGNKIRKYLSLSARPLEKRYQGISSYEQSVKDRLYSDEYKDLVSTESFRKLGEFQEALFTHTQGSDDLSRMLYFDTKTWLVDDLLIKADRMSMAASLELRVPFLDYRLVEFAATLPSRYKINHGVKKYLLKQMMKNILPDPILGRKKMGFPTPLKMMFQRDLADYAFDLLSGTSVMIHNYFKPREIKKILDEHVNRSKDNHRIIWQLIVLEMWMKTWLKK